MRHEEERERERERKREIEIDRERERKRDARGCIPMAGERRMGSYWREGEGRKKV